MRWCSGVGTVFMAPSAGRQARHLPVPRPWRCCMAAVYATAERSIDSTPSATRLSSLLLVRVFAVAVRMQSEPLAYRCHKAPQRCARSSPAQLTVECKQQRASYRKLLTSHRASLMRADGAGHRAECGLCTHEADGQHRQCHCLGRRMASLRCNVSSTPQGTCKLRNGPAAAHL